MLHAVQVQILRTGPWRWLTSTGRLVGKFGPWVAALSAVDAERLRGLLAANHPEDAFQVVPARGGRTWAFRQVRLKRKGAAYLQPQRGA